MTVQFEEIFHTENPARDKFLSRLFGLFSEEVVRHWCRYPAVPYEDLGRPTLRVPGEARGHTLDFTLRHRETGKFFVAEMKCELEFENYRYLQLTGVWQVQHHRSAAFQKFLQLARDPGALEVRVGGRQVRVNGAVLIWGVITSEGRSAVIEEYGFADVLSVEAMVNDLHQWKLAGWAEMLGQLKHWSNELFDSLL
ncbi:MAG: hypothetical protein QHH75_08600 [Bacillota bacterium]|nr:hypothetical protein [Bacillota bacterium]